MKETRYCFPGSFIKSRGRERNSPVLSIIRFPRPHSKFSTSMAPGFHLHLLHRHIYIPSFLSPLSSHPSKSPLLTPVEEAVNRRTFGPSPSPRRRSVALDLQLVWQKFCAFSCFVPMMKTESSFVGKKRDALGQGEKMIRKKCCRRPTKHRSPSTIVQQLYDTCREVFKGPGTVPTPCDVEKMKLVLDKMKAEDFWLSEDLPFFNSDNGITYATIYQSENFSLCLFFLPPKAVIPLHNHPGMTVFSKLLLGSMHIKAYDWVDPSKSDDLVPSSEPRLASLEVDSNFTAPCDTSILYPTAGGNIHSFTALTPCAVLDVMGPPYSKEEDRDCTYYKEFPYSNFSESTTEVKDDCSYGLLKAIDVPMDLKMTPVEYMGPQFVETC